MIGAFIIVRLSSSRLPEKAIMEILDKPMIELMVERVRASRMIDKIVITTSTETSDGPLEKLANKLKVECYRGPLDNVMERIYGAAEKYGCNHIVELLGDNPLVHFDLIDDVIRFYKDGGLDYAATVTKEYLVTGSLNLFSLGIRVQVYSTEAARQYKKFTDYLNNPDKHPCSYIFENPDKFKVGYFEAKGKWAFMNRPDLTFAVNYQKDFDLMKAFFEKQYPISPNFSLKKVYEQLDEEKHLHQLMGNE